MLAVSFLRDRQQGECPGEIVVGDDIGDRGHWLFCLLMTQICPGRDEPFFRPRFLGDKFPVFDYLVELVGSEAYFFFVQVKTTKLGYRSGRGARRLRVNVSREDVQRMIASPVPTYLVGIDEPQEMGYLLSMNEPKQAGLGGLPAKHLLDCDNLEKLWQEVHGFWATRNMVLAGSHFM
jgi:hypothetical protein